MKTKNIDHLGLEFFVLTRNLTMVEQLVAHKTVTTTSIIYAALNNDINILKILFDYYEGNVDKEKKFMEMSQYESLLDIVTQKLKIEKYPTLNSLMSHALSNGSTDLVEKLFDAGIDINAIIIGVTNTNIIYSGKMRYMISYLHNKLPKIYFLLIELKHLQNEEFISKFSAFINPGGIDSFPLDREFSLADLDPEKMVESEHLYQAIINISNKYLLPYLGVCSGAQHLILNHYGSLNKVEGYNKTYNNVEFIPGSFSYFLALSEQEQFELLEQCLFPPVFF